MGLLYLRSGSQRAYLNQMLEGFSWEQHIETWYVEAVLCVHRSEWKIK